MDRDWGKKFLSASKRCDESQVRDFLLLTDAAMGNCDLEVARVLFKSFSDEPDFGTQERVVSVLASAEKAVALRALLEELPRLLRDGREWADVLVGQEVDRRPSLLLKMALEMGSEITAALRMILIDRDFLRIYPGAFDLLNSIE